MRHVLLVTVAAIGLAGCKPSVSLTNATPEEVAKAAEASGEQTQLRPGQWETSIEVVSMDMPEMKGMPAEFGEKMRAELMKPRTVSSCMTEDDVKDHGTKVFGDGENKCKYAKYEMSGGRIDAVMTCPGATGETKLTMTGTFAGDSFTVEQSMDVPSPGGSMRTKARVTGKRTGECKAGADK